jgi:DNA-binding protein HU-beta
MRFMSDGFSPCAGRGNLIDSRVASAMVGEVDGRRGALTKAALVTQMAQETRLTHQQTAAIVELCLEGIIEALSTGDTVALHGFGRCRCGQRWARQGRHPPPVFRSRLLHTRCPSLRGEGFPRPVAPWVDLVVPTAAGVPHVTAESRVPTPRISSGQ